MFRHNVHTAKCFYCFLDNDIDELEKVQASLIKAALGLSKYSRNTPILRALKIKKIGRILDERHLSLTKGCTTQHIKIENILFTYYA